MGDFFLDVDYAQVYKDKQLIGGDVFYSRKIKEKNRVVSVLSDGLGSGVKAGVLATLTSTLAAGCIAGDISIERTAEAIMKSLPVCSLRKISYATFTIVSIDPGGTAQLIEYDNPPALLLREGRPMALNREKIAINQKHEEKTLYYSRFRLEIGDRLIFFSDGVTQSGIGISEMPFGWEWDNVSQWIIERNGKEDLSSRKLSEAIVNRSLANDLSKARDDITCAVIHARKPRKTLLVTGPPIHKERDSELCGRVFSFEGQVIVSGGTTANIVSRESGRKAVVDLDTLNDNVPPTASIEGIALVTEGILTLSRVADLLKKRVRPSSGSKHSNGAVKIVEALLESDEISFLIGTKINEAHQDPNVPVGLEIRRTLAQTIAEVLREKYLKQVEIDYI